MKARVSGSPTPRSRSRDLAKLLKTEDEIARIIELPMNLNCDPAARPMANKESVLFSSDTYHQSHTVVGFLDDEWYHQEQQREVDATSPSGNDLKAIDSFWYFKCRRQRSHQSKAKHLQTGACYDEIQRWDLPLSG